MTERLREHPDLHVYHYNHYEPTAVKTLMTRYGTREAEVDDLLRRKVFVDLYTVVRQAMRIGAESYSLKAVEAMYPFERDAEVTEAGGSILAYQEYLETGRDEQLDGDRRLQRRRLPLDDGAARLAARASAAASPSTRPTRRARRARPQLARMAELERLEAALLEGRPDAGRVLRRRPAALPPARGAARVVGVLRAPRPDARTSCATRTPRRSAS